MENKHSGILIKYHIQKANGNPIDPNADYFVLRLDDGGSDPLHIEACRKAILTYANTVLGTHLDGLAKDIIERYG